jgi:hypothetical protein
VKVNELICLGNPSIAGIFSGEGPANHSGKFVGVDQTEPPGKRLDRRWALLPVRMDSAKQCGPEIHAGRASTLLHFRRTSSIV